MSKLRKPVFHSATTLQIPQTEWFAMFSFVMCFLVTLGTSQAAKTPRRGKSGQRTGKKTTRDIKRGDGKGIVRKTPSSSREAKNLFRDFHIVLLKPNLENGGFGFDKKLKAVLDSSEGKPSDPNLKQLQTSLIGSAVLETERIYRIPRNKFEAYKKQWFEADPSLSITTLDSVTKETNNNETVVDSQNRKSSLEERLTQYTDTQEKDIKKMSESVRNDIARTLTEAGSDVFTLYNATLFEMTRKRRAIVEKELDGSLHSFDKTGMAFDKVMDEIRDEGLPVEIERIETLVAELGDVLGDIDTRYSNHVLSDLLTAANGRLLDSVVQSEKVAERIVTSMLGVAKERISLLQKFLSNPKPFNKMDHFIQPRSSSGLRILPGREVSEAARFWSKEYPWDNFSAKFLLFLGTDNAQHTIESIEEFILEADKAFPAIQKKHQLKFLDQELAHYPDHSKSQLMHEYNRHRRLTGLTEVRYLTDMLAFVDTTTNAVYSQQLKVLNTLKIYNTVLSKIDSKAIYKLISDAAFEYLQKISFSEDFNTDKDIQKAGRSLIRILSKPGADRDVQIIAKSLFGSLSLGKTWTDGLSHKNEEMRRFVMQIVLGRLVKGDPEVTGLYDGFKMWIASKAASPPLSSLPKNTEKLLLKTQNNENEQIWQRTNAARLLNTIKPSNRDTLGFLLDLLKEDDTTVNFYEGSRGMKNFAVRKNAVLELGRMKSHAEEVKPVLAGLVTKGSLVKEYSEESSAEEVKSMLSSIKTPGNRAEEALNYLETPETFNPNQMTGTDRAKTPEEFASIVLRETTDLGNVANETLSKLGTLL